MSTPMPIDASPTASELSELLTSGITYVRQQGIDVYDPIRLGGMSYVER